MIATAPTPEPMGGSLPKNENNMVFDHFRMHDVTESYEMPGRGQDLDIECQDDDYARISDFVTSFSRKSMSGKIVPFDFLEDSRPFTATNTEALSSRASSRNSVFTASFTTSMAYATVMDTSTVVPGPEMELSNEVLEKSWVNSVRTKRNWKGFAPRIQSTSYLNAVRFSPGNPSKVVCAASDGKIYVYDAVSGHPLHPLIGHMDRVISLAVSPQLTYRPSASLLRTHPNASAEGTATTNFVVSGSRDEHVRIWDLASSTCLLCIHAANSPIWAVDVSVGRQGEVMVVTGGGNGKLRSWNALTGRKVASYRGHTGKVSAVRMYLSGDVPLLVSGGEDRVVRVWELLTGKLLKVLSGHSADIYSLYIGTFEGPNSLASVGSQKVGGGDSQSGVIIISGGKDMCIKVWDYLTSSMLFELKGHGKAVQELTVVQWPSTGKKEASIPANTPLLVSCSEDCTVRFWNLLTRKLVKQKKWHSADVSGIDAIVVSNTSNDSHGILVASCGWDKTLHVHDLEEAVYGKSTLSCSPS
ncbi:WD40 repeat domain-containing protein [archaeon]|nr:MAG: WD40 repeat domain-containing protein [archaeon]